jgi:hypothetical protein
MILASLLGHTRTLRATLSAQTGIWEKTVVFHGFPSEGEAQAYWNGAGFPDVCFTLKQRRRV